MTTYVFTPSHTTGIRVAPIVPCVGSHTTCLGHASAWLKAPAGPYFFQAADGQEASSRSGRSSGVCVAWDMHTAV